MKPCAIGLRTFARRTISLARSWRASVPNYGSRLSSVIGREAREQILAAEKRLPTHLFACVGGGSNAIGLFYNFLRDKEVKLVGIEAGGQGTGLGEHAARLGANRASLVRAPVCSKAPIRTFCKTKMARFRLPIRFPRDLTILPSAPNMPSWPTNVGRNIPLFPTRQPRCRRLLSRTEGIIPALESAHAVSRPDLRGSRKCPTDDLVILNLSGRGDKDMDTYRACSMTDCLFLLPTLKNCHPEASEGRRRISAVRVTEYFNLGRG